MDKDMILQEKEAEVGYVRRSTTLSSLKINEAFFFFFHSSLRSFTVLHFTIKKTQTQLNIYRNCQVSY